MTECYIGFALYNTQVFLLSPGDALLPVLARTGKVELQRAPDDTRGRVAKMRHGRRKFLLAEQNRKLC